MLYEQGIIFVATASKDGIPNVSPRTAFWLLDDETIAICDWFRHKTFWNFQENNNIAIAVVDLKEYKGYQLKGKFEIVTDTNLIKEILKKVMAESPHHEFNRINAKDG